MTALNVSAYLCQLHKFKLPPPIPNEIVLSALAQNLYNQCFAMYVRHMHLLFDGHRTFLSQKSRRTTDCIRTTHAPLLNTTARLDVRWFQIKTVTWSILSHLRNCLTTCSCLYIDHFHITNVSAVSPWPFLSTRWSTEIRYPFKFYKRENCLANHLFNSSLPHHYHP